jgi:D-serine deaminase-like pyridoxal phosphate-dependent protein
MNGDDAPPIGPAGRRLPELRLSLRALESNVRLMADWCRDQGVELCPHIKTTMTRPIVERQVATGAWGVTVATVGQAAVALQWGLRRIIIANEVPYAPDLALVRRWLDATPELELFCFVDSAAGLDLARSAMDGVRNPLRALIDVGARGGRTGVRDAAAAVELGKAVAGAAPGLLLAGAGGYEGIRPNLRDAATIATVDAHCRTAVDVFRGLTPLFQVDRPVFTMGGSAFPDRVVHALPGLLGRPGGPAATVPVLRSGCYVTHDHGTYEQVSPVPGLVAALTVRGVVLSTPEEGRAIVGAGRRELPYDAGLPVLISARDKRGAPRPAATATATQIFDHHLILTGVRELRVGDEVDLGISHPCAAFDRWPDIAVVDDEGDVQEVWRPQFR